MMQVDQKNHRKFLKKSTHLSYEIGFGFPAKLRAFEDQETIDFAWVAQQACGTVIFVMSESCGACRYDAIEEIVQSYSSFSYCMLLNGAPDCVETLLSMHAFLFPIIRTDFTHIRKVFNFDSVPFVIILNKKGQVISCGNFYNKKVSLEEKMWPLLEVFYSVPVE
ncbi:hypothetical protein [Paenibacillus alba]|uniref:Thioredoxin domain-containing protein n=1 Tax=Paenibacillus alba TaxID=1197127 RepID=A0ABU6GBL2_9BACL|nr:hypothetical protein [Paenibacillus alba]MEC0231593.1 hypothetical protein [Paenibacillus alba]